MGDLIRHADTSIPGLPSDVAGADVPRELAGILDGKFKEIFSHFEPIQYTTDNGDTFHDEMSVAEARDLLMQRLCVYIISVQHTALLEGMKRK